MTPLTGGGPQLVQGGGVGYSINNSTLIYVCDCDSSLQI